MYTLLSLMTLEMDDISVDVDNSRLVTGINETVSFETLGLQGGYGDVPTSINLEYTVKEIFDDARGKFSVIFGNSAIIDCNYVFSQVIDAILAFIDTYQEVDPDAFKRAEKVVKQMEVFL